MGDSSGADSDTAAVGALFRAGERSCPGSECLGVVGSAVVHAVDRGGSGSRDVVSGRRTGYSLAGLAAFKIYDGSGVLVGRMAGCGRSSGKNGVGMGNRVLSGDNYDNSEGKSKIQMTNQL
ncbi:MAG: hypothetical protein UX78_C0029G0005 [Candidatus Amesbacteria bacterium GW2011_GWA2_47_11]|uniref:Uncharacterized protein n=1 Tax=Candidatus Amesbacteria bacterium GW2011_GWA2_47_11 TaxID=1618357 RepID=A0A0G1TLB5_9BACT|nr:MAG: hypothetical protein UX78_C0029G0005 [Candidatus Amesbacteria bacterium GW2011_GWA2_47_11]